jgi:hypothetical protein
MITLILILHCLYALLRLLLPMDRVDETDFLNAGYPAPRRVDTTIYKLVEVKF